jgi:hypothetical protein
MYLDITYVYIHSKIYVLEWLKQLIILYEELYIILLICMILNNCH